MGRTERLWVEMRGPLRSTGAARRPRLVIWPYMVISLGPLAAARSRFLFANEPFHHLAGLAAFGASRACL